MYEVFTTTLSEKGQLVIPKPARDKAKLKKGDNLILVIENEKILIEKSSNLREKTVDNFRDLIKLSEKSMKDLWDNEDDEIWNQYLK